MQHHESYSFSITNAYMSKSFATPWTVSHKVPLAMRFPQQEYWSGLSFPPPEDLTDPETEPMSLVSPALLVDSLPTEPLAVC